MKKHHLSQPVCLLNLVSATFELGMEEYCRILSS